MVGEYDGYYASHIRNRAKFLQAAIDEFMDIVRRSDTRGQVSHLNVRYNTGEAPDAWERAVDDAGRRARREGLDVAADCTPYQDGGGGPDGHPARLGDGRRAGPRRRVPVRSRDAHATAHAVRPLLGLYPSRRFRPRAHLAQRPAIPS